MNMPEEAWDEIDRLAREHGLIYQAYGGVVVLVHPDTQKSEGLYEFCQYSSGLGKHPKTLERERCT